MSVVCRRGVNEVNEDSNKGCWTTEVVSHGGTPYQELGMFKAWLEVWGRLLVKGRVKK